MSECVELWNRARKLHEENKFLEAADVYTKAVLSPENNPRIKGNCMNNLGIIIQSMGHLEKAAGCFAFAISMRPKSAEILNNIGNVRLYCGDYLGAQEFFLKAMAMNPESAEARQNSAVVSLIMGEFRRGWIGYESRWKCPTFTTKEFPTKKPRWKGQNLEGKTIMLTHEQGFGDSIMFIRYAKMVKDRGAARVRFLGPPELRRLFDGVDGIDEYLIANTDEDFDFHCPLLSLPKVFKTTLETVPSSVPYITRFQRCPVPESPEMRVGIAWAGRPEHGKDRWRSITAKHFTPLMDLDKIAWVSLQVGAKASMVSDLPKVIDLSSTLRDFTDTAGAIAHLDLIISIDTALVHLAGAMAKPVWMLTPYNPDWRWMLNRTDSPWYPTMRLFRQPKQDDWDSVFADVRNALLDLL